MPDISKINNVEVGNISKLDSITFADGQKVNNQDVSLITEAFTLISTPLDITVSDTAVCEVDITSGLDSTYDEFQVHFINLHPETDSVNLEFQVNAHDGSSQLTGFDESIVSTYVDVYHAEAGSSSGSNDYNGARDQVGTGYQQLIYEVGNDVDQSCSGVFKLYAPSSTTYVKHFLTEVNGTYKGDYTMNAKTSGYISTANAITQIRFRFSSGDIDAGIIKLYGIVK